MGGNLAKSPLVAVLYASLMYFVAVFLPFSDFYSQMLYEYSREISLTGYLIFIGYALWICIAAALIMSSTEKAGFGAVLLMVPVFWGLQWIAPLAQQLALGEQSGGMAQGDTLWRIIQGCVCTLIMLVLSMLLYPKTGEKKGAKHKLKILPLLIFMIVLPLVYLVLYLVLGYFLGWTNDAVRIFYQGGGDEGIFGMIIGIFLEAPRYAGFALIKGLLLAACSIPLMMLLVTKKVMFIIANVMLYLSGALLFLLPTPTMTWEVALPHLIANGAILVVFGVLSAILLHLCVVPADQAKAAAAAPPPKGAAPAARRA